MCSNILKMTGNTLTGLYLFLDVRAFENWSNRCQLGNFALFKESLKYFALHAAKKSLLSFKSFTGRSAFCIAFELLRILISFVTSASVTGLKVSLPRFLWTAVIILTFINSSIIWAVRLRPKWVRILLQSLIATSLLIASTLGWFICRVSPKVSSEPPKLF